MRCFSLSNHSVSKDCKLELFFNKKNQIISIMENSELNDSPKDPSPNP